jgi:hypothetical protein
MANANWCLLQKELNAVMPVTFVMNQNFVMARICHVQKTDSNQNELFAVLLVVHVMKMNSVMENLLNAPRMNSKTKEPNAVTVKNVPRLNFALETKPNAHQSALNQKEKYADLPKVHVIKPKNALEKMKTAQKMNSRELELNVAKPMVPVKKMLNVMEKMPIAQKIH